MPRRTQRPQYLRYAWDTLITEVFPCQTKTIAFPPFCSCAWRCSPRSAPYSKLAQIPVGNDFLRISFENLPLLLAGYLFGAAAGGAVGVCGDLIGCLLRGYAVNPIITLGAGLVGVVAGLFGKRGVTAKPRLWLSVAAAHVVGSLIVKSFGIWLYFATPLPELALRIPTYILTGAAEYVILTLILKNKALSALLEKV